MPDKEYVSDKALIEAIRESDQQAFKEFYFRYFDNIYRFLYWRTRDEEISRDLTQELFLRLWRNRAGLNPNLSIKAYIFRAAGNLAIDHLRHRISEAIQPTEMPTLASPEDINRNMELKDELHRSLAQLPEDQRTIILMNRVEGMKYREIAEALDISIKTVEKKMSLALKFLRKSLKHLLVLILLVKFLQDVGLFLFTSYF